MGKERGYIKWYRVGDDCKEDELFGKEPLCKWAAWIDLVSLAEYRDGVTYRHGVTVETKRGCVYKSIRYLAERWRWSINKTLRFLKTLEKQQKTKTQRSNVINCISILNYRKYQGDGDTNGDTNGDTSKKYKEYKENICVETRARERNEIESQEDETSEEEERVLGYQNEILKSQITIEQTCMTLHLTPTQYRGLIQDFTAEQLAKGTAYLGYSDYRRHAYDWIRAHIAANEIDQDGHTAGNTKKAITKGQNNGNDSTGNGKGHGYDGLSPKDRAIREANRRDRIAMGLDPDPEPATYGSDFEF